MLLIAVPAWAGQGRFVVKLRSGASANPFTRSMVRTSNLWYLNSELRSALSAGSSVRPMQHMGVLLVQGEKSEVESSLRDHPLVEYYEPERSWKIQATVTDNPASQYRSPWMGAVLGLGNDVPDPNVTYSGGSPVVVAVIDTGARLNHPYLAPALARNVSESADGADNDGNGYADDVYGANVIFRNGDTSETGTNHGTHVAGLVKMVRDQAIPYYSKAAAVQILPIRFIDSSGVGSTSAAIEAMNYARARGARVVNCSWGAKGESAFSRALFDAMVELYAADVFFSVAAGNAEFGGPNNNDAKPFFPASYNIPALVSVASLTARFTGGLGNPQHTSTELSYFSNYGASSVHLAAPGDFQDGAGSTDGLWSTSGNSDGYERKKGTSMAAPVVAGVAGVMRAINPALTNYEIRQLMMNTVQRSPLLSQVQSSGSLNAGAAFAAAASASTQGLRPPVPESAYTLASANTQTQRSGGGGCGMIAPVGGEPPEGPWGGNSLALLSFAYLAAISLRALKRRSIQ